MKDKTRIVLLTVIAGINILVSVYIYNTNITKKQLIESSGYNKDLMIIINMFRVKSGYNKYTVNPNLCKIAQIRLEQIKTDWSHDQFSTKLCPTCRELAENLAKNYSTNEEILQGWINSPKHLKLLRKNYKYACVMTKDKYTVLMFANFK